MSTQSNQAVPPAHPHESAGQHMVTRVPTALPGELAAAVIDRLRGNGFDAVDPLYLVDGERRLQAIVTLRKLVAASGDATVAELADYDIASVAPEQDQEEVANLALEQGLASVPVVDAAGRLLGAVPTAALLRILRQEHVEDMNRLTGILKNGDQALDAIEGSTLRRVLHRLPWLMLGLLGSAVATWLMARFESTLRAELSIAFFIPAVVYLADAIGTQTEAVAVRGLTFSRASLWQLLAGELRTGMAIGLVLALLIFPAVWLYIGDHRLAMAVALAVVAAGTCATSVGFLLPWILSRLDMDPAYGSGPIATIVQDLLSLLTYFVAVSVLMA